MRKPLCTYFITMASFSPQTGFLLTISQPPSKTPRETSVIQKSVSTTLTTDKIFFSLFHLLPVRILSSSYLETINQTNPEMHCFGKAAGFYIFFSSLSRFFQSSRTCPTCLSPFFPLPLLPLGCWGSWYVPSVTLIQWHLYSGPPALRNVLVPALSVSPMGLCLRTLC